jgi:DNA primase catalytic subunit
MQCQFLFLANSQDIKRSMSKIYNWHWSERLAFASTCAWYSLRPSQKSYNLFNRQAIKLIANNFEDLVETHQLLNLDNEKNIMHLLPSNIRLQMEEYLRHCKSTDVISNFTAMLHRPYIQQMYPDILEKLQMAACYPRLDTPVSTQECHLLRLPFSIHEKTGKVCVPIAIHKAEHFNPLQVPTAKYVCMYNTGY